MSRRGDEDIPIDGEPSKRFGVSCDGRTVGSFDTAKEAWEAYRKDKDLILPVLKKNSKRVRGEYHFRDGRKEIPFEQLRRVAQQEK